MGILNRHFIGRTWGAYLSLVMLLLILPAVSIAGHANGVPGFELGGSKSPAPAFVLELLDAVKPGSVKPDPVKVGKGVGSGTGTPVTLKELAGEVVLLHFWATWCAPCIKELPAFATMNKRYGQKGVRFVAVALDNRKKVRAYLAEHAIDLPVYLDQYGKVMRSYGVGALPVTVVIGRDSKALGRFTGAREWDSAAGRAFLESLLDKGVE